MRGNGCNRNGIVVICGNGCCSEVIVKRCFGRGLTTSDISPSPPAKSAVEGRAPVDVENM